LKQKGKYASVTKSPKAGITDLVRLKEVIEAGKLSVVIDRRYKLEQIREAHAYAESFREKGNVFVSVVSENNQTLAQKNIL
jgi:NADPH:quinone reductase-like Zn-dependent oxidoreductase